MDKATQGTLQRGKACLRCRKRKMRCDGAKPACQQCIKAKKGEACEYDDGKGKTRTQILRETVAKLEQRIRDLEDPDYVASSVMLYDPHTHCHSESSSSSFGSPESSYLSASHSPFPSESPASPPDWSHVQGIVSPIPSPFVTPLFFDDHQPPFHPPPELGQMLLDIFAPHRRQCGLAIHMGQLRDSLSLGPKQRHPVLMNAVYLWACFVSRPEPLCQHEEHYLQQALIALPEALRLQNKVIDVIQASCLLSLYFLSTGRLLEGGYHANAAAALAVQIGLGRNSFLETQNFLLNGCTETDLKPSKFDIQEGERIFTFWQVYNLDRCWSVVLRKPCIIQDGPDPKNAIHCPWPQEIANYEIGYIDSNINPMQTIQSFLAGTMSPSGFSIPALRVKASTLFAQADHLLTDLTPGTKPSVRFTEKMRSLEHTITLFLSTLIPVHQLDVVLPEEKHSLIVAHTIAQSAIIHMHRPFAEEVTVSFEKCTQAARACIAIIKHITEQDFGFLEPIIAPCWWSVADIIVGELDTLEASWPLIDCTDVRNDLGTLLYAMTRLAPRFPIIAPALSKLQKRLS